MNKNVWVVVVALLWSTVVEAQSGGCPRNPNAPCIGKKCACSPALVGDPVNMNSLQTYHRATDFEIRTALGPFVFERMYTSSLESWRAPTAPMGPNGVLAYRATPFGTPESSTGVREDSVNWWHSLFSFVVRNGQGDFIVYDTDGVTHQFKSTSPWPHFLSKFYLASGSDDSLVYESGEFRFVTARRTLVFSESMQESCSGSCAALYPLSAIEDHFGREVASLTYFEPSDAGASVPRGCPYGADAGAGLLYPYIDEVTLAGGLVLQFAYGELTNEGGLFNCRLTEISASQSPIQTYSYSPDPTVSGPVVATQVGGLVEQATIVPAASFSIQVGGVSTVVQNFDGGIVENLLGQGVEPDRVFADSAWEPAPACDSLMTCCPSVNYPKYMRIVSTVGTRGTATTTTGLLDTRFYSFADYQFYSTHNMVVGATEDVCDAGFACSPGVIRYGWRALSNGTPNCYSQSSPGHPWGVQDKRGSVSVTKYQWDVVDGGTGQPTANVPALFEVRRGASQFDGNDALEIEQRSYVYSSQAAQYLKTITAVSSLNSSGQKIIQKNYAPFGDGFVERASIVEGYTQELDGTQVLERRGVFYLDQRQCVSSGADPLGRALRVEGPCRVSSMNATSCFGGLDAEYPVTEYMYYSSSDSAAKRGRLASVTRYPTSSCAGGLTTTFDSYETYGGVTELHDENNVQLTASYSGRQPSLLTVDPAGLNLATELGYDDAKHVTYIKRPEGNYLVFCYRTGLSRAGCVGPLSNKLQWVAKSSDAAGSSTAWSEKIKYTYWPTGELNTESYFLPGYSTPRLVKSYTPDLHGRPAWEGVADGANTPFIVATRAFDAANNVVGLGAPFHGLVDGGTPSSPDYCRLSSGAISPLCTKFEYDRANRLTTVDGDPDGDSSTSADVIRTCFDYDAVGNIRRMSNGCSTDTAPCASHNTGSMDAGACTLANTEYDIDDFGAVVEVRFPWSSNTGGGTTRYRYDARNNVVSSRNASMVSPYYRAFTWDLLDRPTGMYIKSLATSVTLHTIGYDAYTPPSGCAVGQNLKGRVAWRSDGYGTTWFSYDTAGRTVAEYKTRDGSTCTSGLDTNHNTIYTYTPNGNVSSITYPYGRKVTYLYGAGGLTDRVDSITVDRFKLTGFPPVSRTSTVTLLSSAKWEPFGRLRYYQQYDYLGGTPTYRYRTVNYALGGPTAAESEPSTVCAASTAEVDGNDTSGRVRTLFVSDGGVSPGAGSGDVLTLTYAWRKDMIYKEELCFTGAGQTSGYPYERVYRYDNLRRLTGATGLVSVQNGTQYARAYGYDSRGNRSSLSVDGCGRNLVEGTGRQQDLLYWQGPNGTAGCNGQMSGYTYTYDADGRVVNETTAPSGWWSRDFGYGGDTDQGGFDSVYKSVVTHSGGDSTIDYYYDARNRLWLRVLPAGHEEKRFYDLWDNVLTVASPLSANTAVLAYDDFVWLDGKLVATLRNGFTPASPFSSGGLHFDETGNSDCGRVGATGACGLTHIVNDILPKPILAIHSNSGLISGVGMYDEFGAVNQVPVISGTNHPYTTMGPGGGVVGVGRLPGFAQADARVLYNYVDLPTGVSATVNNDAGVTGTQRGHVWSDWAPRDNYRATVRVGAPSGTTQGVQVDVVEFRSYATGAIPYFPTLRFPGQYADAETEKYINWNRFYDPSTGRYLQPEPLLQSPHYIQRMALGGDLVPTYAYALNNPQRYVDANGLGAIDSLVGGVMFAVGLLTPGARVDVRWANDTYVPWSLAILTVENHPWEPAGTTTTFGLVVCSAGQIDEPPWRHEQQHIKQWQAFNWIPGLTEGYIPAHVAAQGYSTVTTGTYDTNDPFETGPYGREYTGQGRAGSNRAPVRPWPWR